MVDEGSLLCIAFAVFECDVMRIPDRIVSRMSASFSGFIRQPKIVVVSTEILFKIRPVEVRPELPSSPLRLFIPCLELFGVQPDDFILLLYLHFLLPCACSVLILLLPQSNGVVLLYCFDGYGNSFLLCTQAQPGIRIPSVSCQVADAYVVARKVRWWVNVCLAELVRD